MIQFAQCKRAPNALILAVLTAGLAIALPSHAQSRDGADPLVPNGLCMVRVAADGRSLSIIAPLTARGSLEAKGFERVACSKSFPTPQSRETYKDAVCHMASSWREAQIDNYERVYGERPGVLCGLAEVVVSQWRFRSKK